MNELVAPESIRVVMGSALDFRIMISVWSRDSIFVKLIQIDSILKSIGGNGTVCGPLICFPIPPILVPLPWLPLPSQIPSLFPSCPRVVWPLYCCSGA